jgi:nuclear GTP-binding protein
VIVQVLDARDPLGTRAKRVEEHVKNNCPHKHIVLLLNKCDLIPTWATKRWLHVLGKEYPTLAFHASVTKPFGKGSLISLLRQFQHLHKDKQQISVGFIGTDNPTKNFPCDFLAEENCFFKLTGLLMIFGSTLSDFIDETLS